jgi:uncharacterized phiE125 gp8 family phage protein
MLECLSFLDADTAENEPITLAEVKAQCRIDADNDDEDDLIAHILIPAARQQAQALTGAILRPARFKQTVLGNPGADIRLAVHPLIVLESLRVKTLDGGWRDMPLATVQALSDGGEVLLLPTDTNGWPPEIQEAVIIEIIFTAGFTRPQLAELRPGVRHWLLLVVAWGYAQRECFTTGAAIQSMPPGFQESLLASVKRPPQF